MSVFNFLPSNSPREQFVVWENAFNDEQIEKIIEIGESFEFLDAKVGVNETETNTVVDPKIRRSRISWVSLNENTKWLYQSLAYIIRKINGDCFSFDLYGFGEHMQYTVYDGNNEDHYDWHLDFGNNDPSPRKISVVVQLSDPEDYEGGELQLYCANEPFTVKKAKGLLCAFPSWVLHRCTPVTKGVRKSLVVWVAGPNFR